MGDQKALGLMTNEEFHLFSTTFFDTVKLLKSTLQAMQGSIPYTSTHPSHGFAEPWSIITSVTPPTPIHFVTSLSSNSSMATHMIQPPQKPSQQCPAPIPGAVIPHIPQGPNNWKMAMQQWDDFLQSVQETIAAEFDACVGFDNANCCHTDE
ncbi:hypothetical protein AX14_004756 [Amanita brunnescens Koide BX004]|nr:hypothetical protein AX14_004756 [Amanita brunnescens Koide BX004]